LDIETTGFASRTSCLYLIGCAYLSEGSWQTRQWMAENPSQEPLILQSFLQFASKYKVLVHFNGNNFDLPFLMQKCTQHGLPNDLEHFQGIDLYKRVSPYKFFLGIPNCKQRTLEQFLGINRQDVFTGSELIGIYHQYVNRPNEFSEKSLFLHNAEDIKGMLEIMPLLSYSDLFQMKVHAKKVQANTYHDFAGNERRELLMYLSLPVTLPKPISINANNCYFKADGKEGTLRVPIYEDELKYFYENYHDYYYLPEEDTALHKSVAQYVDKDYRLQATASTCYTRKYSSYLPQWEYVFEPFFKRDHRSKEIFFELTDEMKRNREFFHTYANHVLQVMSTMY
jgi:hypothetical protein